MFKRSRSNENFFDGDLSQFPTLATESWRVNEFIGEEAAVQRHRLSIVLAITRIFIAIVSLIMLSVSESKSAEHQTIMVVMIFYILLVFGLMRLSGKNREKVYVYNFLITFAEIALLGYWGFVIEKKTAISFIFLSVGLSAMLLPFWRLLTVVIFSMIVVCVFWLGPAPNVLELLLNGHVTTVASIKTLMTSENWRWLANILVGLLVLGVLVNRLATWSFKNDVKARFRHKQMRQVLSFNRAVIEHLRSGVIVVSGNGKVLSINRRAIILLNISTTKAVTELSVLSKELEVRYRNWLGAGVVNQSPYRHNDNAEDVFLSFDSFGEYSQRNIVMITIESVNETLQQAQDAKLAALGRLTAGVAHEIRNPMASINSASQLLAETTEDPAHQNLARVILKNVKRTDQIISDILGLFKDTKAERKLLPVQKTLRRYAVDFLEVHQNDQFELHFLDKEKQELFFYFDAGQLEQVLWNLLQNSIKYANPDGKLKLILRCHLSATRQSIYIDVIDNGKGISPDKVSQIYEPFFSGGSGSGLGLYLVRELCSANNANIVYLPLKKAYKNERAERSEKIVGACFRIATKVYFSQQIKPKID